MASIPWRHSIPLGHGIVTPGTDPHHLREAYLNIPERLDGLSVLDIGAWDGYFAFQAEARGASHVVAIDEWKTNRAGFDVAHKLLDSKVEPHAMSVYDLELLGPFDVVFFFGVLYHLKHPLLALEKIRDVCKADSLLILETHIDLPRIERPVCAFYERNEAADDDKNWVGPNRACVEAWLRSSGFSRVEYKGGVNLTPRHEGNETIEYGRAAWHARP